MNGIQYLQDIWMDSTCFGCGPANPEGMQLKSRWSDDGRFVIAEYAADAKFNSGMPNVMYGGSVASLVDCHSIWTAIAFAYKAENRSFGSDPALLYVTGKLSVTYMKPTPLSEPLYLRAWAEGDIGKKIDIVCELGPSDAVTARGLVRAVRLN
ncbi:MAG: PaaI family thioesterase [Thermodesulfobacteriota bacterium]|nr:PaaI family thioesterase [Thermodesulfobacteriota bacterium]